jgi:hypothetical protein
MGPFAQHMQHSVFSLVSVWGSYLIWGKFHCPHDLQMSIFIINMSTLGPGFMKPLSRTLMGNRSEFWSKFRGTSTTAQTLYFKTYQKIEWKQITHLIYYHLQALLGRSNGPIKCRWDVRRKSASELGDTAKPLCFKSRFGEGLYSVQLSALLGLD